MSAEDPPEELTTIGARGIDRRMWNRFRALATLESVSMGTYLSEVLEEVCEFLETRERHKASGR